MVIGRALRFPARALERALGGWHGAEQSDPQLDHGHAPFGAWEAELTAYARLRTGSPLKVVFSILTGPFWVEEVHLPRPRPQVPPAQAFATAELLLEHALAHYRHGWREAALLWHVWSHPTEPVLLPWAPWDRVPLPVPVLREALAECAPELRLPRATLAWSDRRRCAARWLVAAWQDGCHRALEVKARPGLAERLPLPPPPRGNDPWSWVLFRLAAGDRDAGDVPPSIHDAAGALVDTGADDLAVQVEVTLGLVEALAARNALPPTHKQHPPWLLPPWGRWRRGRALEAALDHVSRSPSSPELAAATAAARRRVLSLGTQGGGAPGAGRAAAPAGPAQPAGRRLDEPPAADAEVAAGSKSAADWGVTPPESLPQQSGSAPTAGAAPRQAGAEGSGEQHGATGGGSGAGTLGALHVIRPSPADRVAYWQLRGALAPEVERLVERLQASSDAYYASTPRRFQRSGRLDRNRLAAAAAGREAVFIRHIHRPEPEHALILLLDCSASMTVHAERLREIAILAEAATSTVGAHVTAFTFGASWERMEPGAHGAPLVTLGRELHPHGGTPFGPALASAAAWLAQQPYRQRRLWVFSDGGWSSRDRLESAWKVDQLRDVVVWVLDAPAPPPPHPMMRLVEAPSLAAFVDLAPRYFWGDRA